MKPPMPPGAGQQTVQIDLQALLSENALLKRLATLLLDTMEEQEFTLTKTSWDNMVLKIISGEMDPKTQMMTFKFLPESDEVEYVQFENGVPVPSEKAKKQKILLPSQQQTKSLLNGTPKPNSNLRRI